MSLLNPFAIVESTRSCRVCGCTDDRACVGGPLGTCYWVTEELCSACAPVTSPTRVNLTTPTDADRPGVDRKADTNGQGSPHGRQPARNTGGAPGSHDPGAPAGTRPAWHEISYTDPRTGPKTVRWVSLVDAREKAAKLATRYRTPVEIWAVYRDSTGRETRSALVDTVIR